MLARTITIAFFLPYTNCQFPNLLNLNALTNLKEYILKGQ